MGVHLVIIIKATRNMPPRPGNIYYYSSNTHVMQTHYEDGYLGLFSLTAGIFLFSLILLIGAIITYRRADKLKQSQWTKKDPGFQYPDIPHLNIKVQEINQSLIRAYNHMADLPGNDILLTQLKAIHDCFPMPVNTVYVLPTKEYRKMLKIQELIQEIYTLSQEDSKYAHMISPAIEILKPTCLFLNAFIDKFYTETHAVPKPKNIPNPKPNT